MVQVEVHDSGAWVKTLHITVPADQVEAEYDRALDRLRRKVNLPGFRPGKVPRQILQSRFARTLESDLVQQLVPRAYEEAVREANVIPLGEPDIRDLKFEPSEPLTFRAVVETWPRIEVKGLDDLELEQEIEPVTSDQVDEALQALRQNHPELVPVERPSIQGDVLEVDLEPVDIHGKRLTSLKRERVTLEAGSRDLLPELREASVGIAPGGERFLEVQYPEDFRKAELRGQKRRYRFIVRAIREKKLRPLDDEFARMVDPELDLEGLRGHLHRRLEKEAEARARVRLEETLIDRLIDRNPFSLSPGMIERGVQALRQRVEEGREAVSSPEMERHFLSVVERIQKRQVILRAMAEQEGIGVTEEELEARIEAQARRAGLHPARLRRLLEERGELERLREDLLERKTFDAMLGRVVVHEYVRSGPEGERRTKGGIILPGRASG